MSVELLLVAITFISILTSLTTEAIKKIIYDKNKADNVIACCCSFVISLACGFGYLFYYELPMTNQAIVTIVALVFISFLCATCGYDKVMQTFKQVKGSGK